MKKIIAIGIIVVIVAGISIAVLSYIRKLEGDIYSLARSNQKQSDILEKYTVNYEVLYDGLVEHIGDDNYLVEWLEANDGLDDTDRGFLVGVVSGEIDYSSDKDTDYIDRKSYKLAIYWYMRSYEYTYQIKYALESKDSIDIYLESVSTGVEIDARMTGRRMFPMAMIIKLPLEFSSEIDKVVTFQR